MTDSQELKFEEARNARIRKEFAGLQDELEVRQSKLNNYRQHLATESNYRVVFQLEQDIEAEKSRINEINEILTRLEGEIKAGQQRIDALKSTVSQSEPPAAGAAASMDNIHFPEIPKFLTKYFSLSELKNVCFELGINYEDLEFQTRSGLARSLVMHLATLDDAILSKFLKILERERSHVPWRSIFFGS